MSATRSPPSTFKHPTQIQQAKHSMILNRSQSITIGSDDDVYVSPPPLPPPESTVSTSSALLSPSMSLSSSSTLHYKASTMADPHSRSSSSNNSRHFYSSGLGRPPGCQAKRKTTPTPTPSSSFPMISSPSKTIPMKELQKIIADLKKENFDLKLRLYHLEQQAEKDMDKYWLMDENQRLQLELDDRTMQMEKLEQTISLMQQQKQQEKTSPSSSSSSSSSPCDASTQVTFPPPPPSNRSNHQASTIDTSSESRSHVAQISPFSAPVLPTFPADPASFGLPTSSALSTSAVASATTSRTTASSRTKNIDVAAMVDRFQHVQLASPKVNRRSSSSAAVATAAAAVTASHKPPVVVDEQDHGRVTGWLDKIPIPSFMSSPPASTPSSSSYTPSSSQSQ
ncbi:hypothetical protein BCR42DRAFT_450640 [Absidia repens]|uniref:Centrosomin N-terminal motif 1 domain-containing protein n=1 Tax=Absidia repens TaxID=90262 RepID=A0A1X2IM90_9FUNG|nr:hypothetical protein BCR42DRAFT_450640 [Absidia repens]